MDEILISFFRGQAEGMRSWALKADNMERRQLMLAIAETYSQLYDQLVELGKMQGTASPNLDDETAAH